MNSIEMKIDYYFSNKMLLEQAMTHKSFSFEKKKQIQHNEKLEFLGDAVIDLIAGDCLYHFFPEDDEGHLSKKRASLVNEDSLAQIAVELDLAEHIQLGKGEMMTGGFFKPRIMASAVEALFGALYLDGGFQAARLVGERIFKNSIANLKDQESFAADYKTRLQEVAQRVVKITPTYVVIAEEGPGHEKVFTVEIRLKEECLATGQGRSKKIAEQMAAQIALQDARWKGV